MKKIFKRNQIVITALAAMIAVAGYIQYTGNIDFLAREANSNDVVADISDEDVEKNKDEANLADKENQPENVEGENPGEALLASSNNVNMTAQLKLNREQVRSKNKEALMEIINSSSINEAQKEDAVKKMLQLTENADKEMAAETLLETKGFVGAVVTITDDNVDVVIDADNISDEERAQIEDIVKRKTSIKPQNIVISMMNKK